MEWAQAQRTGTKKITFWKDAVDEVLVKVFIESYETAPLRSSWTRSPTCRCTANRKEREANHDAAFGSLQEIQRIVAQLRAAWPAVKIIVRGDSSFLPRNQLMSCAGHQVDFVIGQARNQRLRKIIGG